jgi:hypothetical protein
VSRCGPGDSRLSGGIRLSSGSRLSGASRLRAPADSGRRLSPARLGKTFGVPENPKGWGEGVSAADCCVLPRGYLARHERHTHQRPRRRHARARCSSRARFGNRGYTFVRSFCPNAGVWPRNATPEHRYTVDPATVERGFSGNCDESIDQDRVRLHRLGAERRTLRRLTVHLGAVDRAGKSLCWA